VLKRLNRRLRVGYLFRNFAFVHRFFDVFITADAWHPHYHLITAQFVDQARQKGKELYVWTVNKPQLLNSLSAFSLDGIITDTLFHTQN
jgi:glycerophosphoryl diester phosphodiesterase